MARSFNSDDYVDVAERIRQFNEKYPEGTLQAIQPPYVVSVGEQSFIVYGAAAYRTPNDERPGIGFAWEPVPGPTPFTKNSELMNAETSAWGRAILALASFESKKVASANEVRSAVEKQDTDSDIGALKAEVFELALAKGSAPNAEAVAAMFDVTVEGLQDEGILRAILDGGNA